MEYLWVINEANDPSEIEFIKKELGVPEIIAKVLLQRNIKSFDEARKFFRPDLSELYSPFLMKEMDLAIKRLVKALQRGENIRIYGDYDVDGTTGTALLYLVLSGLVGRRISYYIPDRISEGYGLSKEAIQAAKDDGIDLILTVDCGITAVEEVQFANELGMEVIVCDHHQPGEELPPAVAVLDPKRKDDEYPFKELAGCGVAFKLLQALYQELNLPQDELNNHLDLVAIGSCADIVPLVDENRILVKHGLDLINQNPRVGLRALIENAGLHRREIQASTIVFSLAPRINAVGRMGDATRAVKLFTSNSIETARDLARILEEENRSRKDIDEVTFKEAVSLIEEKLNQSDRKAFVLYKEDWHPGVIGIVASRIVEKFYKPTIMISVSDGVGKGSARSVEDFDVFSAIKECEDLLLEFGGHKYAAGLSIKLENIPEFIDRFGKYVNEHLESTMLTPKIQIDAKVHLDEFTSQVFRILKLFGPFGPMNLRPVFASYGCRIVEGPTVIGKNHLKMKVTQGQTVFEAIGFNLGDKMEMIKSNPGRIDLVYTVQENYWNGKTTMQLRLRDIKISE
ncbi:MAG: single-stranded-DNA-specific exonuclease RecJ [Calditrichia bacterium]